MILGKTFQPFPLILCFSKIKVKTPSLPNVKLLEGATWLTLYPTINLRYTKLSIKNSANEFFKSKALIYSASADSSNIHFSLLRNVRREDF